MTEPSKHAKGWARRHVLGVAAAGILALAGALVLVYAADSGADPAASRLTAAQALAQSKAGRRILIDVRSLGEWRATGVPKGARTVTIHNPGGMEAFLKEVLKTVGGDKTKPIAVICARGGRSARAQRYLRANGFADVADVSEGMLGRGERKGWLANGLPVEKCQLC